MQLNLIQFIDLKMRSDFNKIRILRLCSDLSFIINHWKDLKYYMINMKIDKACRAINDTMEKYYFLNKIWLKFRRGSSKLNFVLTILKRHKYKIILTALHFLKMLMCVKRVSCYFIVFLMFAILQSVIFLESCFLFDIFI